MDANTTSTSVVQSEDETAKRVQACLARHEAPVKLAYLKPSNPAAQHQTDAAPQAKDGATPVTATSAGGAGEQNTKSKRQQRREQKQQRGVQQLCNNFVLGRCTHGDTCRFNHNLDSFLSARPQDLPGSCPFSSAGSCPYSITCRWACSHTANDNLHTQLRAYYANQAATGTAASTATATEAENAANGGSADEAGGISSSDIPQGVITLTAAEKIDQTLNVMPKDVQHKLWKNRYNFSRADGVLKDLGLRLSFKPVKADAVAANGGASTAQQSQPKDGAALQETAAATGVETGEPASKKARVDTDAVATAVADSEKIEAAKAVAAAATDAAELAMETEETAGPVVKTTDSVVGSGQAAAAAAGGAAATATTTERKEAAAMHVEVPLRREEKKVIDFREKTVLAPLTTVGNLPFRRVCKTLGAHVTIGEMALCANLLQGQASEWALLKRHPSEDLFGVQIAGGFPDAVARTCQLIDESTQAVDFVDINMGCPIDIVCDRGAGSALLLKPKKIADIARAADSSMSLPLTLKTRMGYYDNENVTHTFVDQIRSWGPIALTLHGRTRQQRYSRQADWQYIQTCTQAARGTGLQLIGNGDVFSYTDWNAHLADQGITTCMIGRGALIKPWVFTEINEQRHWDISAGERLDLLKSFCSAGLEHWGSDNRGVETTRKFLLEWLSYTHRYIPIGLLEVVPQRLHWRAPAMYGRSDLETLLSSDSPSDWIRISKMLLGRAPAGFTFTPKHKSNAYSSSAAPVGTPSTASGAGGVGYECDDQAEG